MSERDDGGPAFPGQIETGAVYPDPVLGRNVMEYAPVPGMTLRDYFASKAMAAIVTNPNAAQSEGRRMTDENLVAETSYAMADAMLRARKI